MRGVTFAVAVGPYGPERWTNDARRSMIEHDFLLTVARSPEEPFDFLIDLRNAAQGEPYCREAEKTSDAPIGPAKV
jgi:hypothetical protein